VTALHQLQKSTFISSTTIIYYHNYYTKKSDYNLLITAVINM